MTNKPILLSAHRIQFPHPSGRTYILNIPKLQVFENQCVLIVGQNGAGKSSLLSFFAGYLHLNAGKIFWKGKLLKPVGQRLLPGFENMAFIPQMPQLDPFLSVDEQLNQWCRSYPKNEAKKWKDSSVVLFGLKKIINSKTGDLSGGEKRRLALSKTRLGKPGLILLDEPFSDLDAKSKTDLAHMLQVLKLEWKPSLLIVSHEAKEIQWLADEIWTLEKGRIIETVSRRNHGFEIQNHQTALLLGFKNLFPARSKFFSGLHCPNQIRFFQLPPDKILCNPGFGNAFLGTWNLIGQWEDLGQWKSTWTNSGGELRLDVLLPNPVKLDELCFWISESHVQFFK